MLTLMSIEHQLLRSLDFTDTIEKFALATCQPPCKTRTDGLTYCPSVGVVDGVWNERTNGRTDGQTDAGNRIWCICDIGWQ